MQLSKLGAEYSRLLDSLPASETQVLQAARALEIQGDADTACAFLNEATRRCPSVLLRKALAALHLKHGRFEESARVIGLALDDAPRDVPAMLLLAEAQIKCGEHQSASRTLAHAERHGASKLRVFKLERQIDEAPTAPSVPAAGAPRLDDRLPGADPADSSVFEDGSFSNLSSFELADAPEAPEDDSANIFETLVDGYDDDPADRSFDDLLEGLGVPVDEDSPTDPNRTGSMVLEADPDVAAQWGLGDEDDEAADPDDPTSAISIGRIRPAPSGDPADEGRPRYHTPRFQESPDFQRPSSPPGGGDSADDSFPSEKTEMLDFERPSTPSRGDARPPAGTLPPRPPRTSQDRTSENRTSENRTSENRTSENRTSEDAAGRASSDRPLPPSVQQSRRDQQIRRDQPRRTGQNRSASAPQRKAQRKPRRSPQPNSTRQNKRRLPLAIIPAALLVVLIAAALTIITASKSAADAAHGHLETFRSATAPDTYVGYITGEQALERAAATESFLGASADAFLADLGMMGQSRAARLEALAELARLSAMVEYRFERLDARESRQRIERAAQAVAADPRLEVARSYRLLASGRPEEAAAMLDETRANFPGFSDATTALLHAHLDDDNLQAAATAAEALGELDSPSVHQHYVLGLNESRQGKDAADARLGHIIETLSPEHVSARIARSYTLRSASGSPEHRELDQADKAKSLDQAAALLDEVFGPLQDKASPLERAHAHIARGELYVQRDERARAEEQFRKAIEVVPSRGSVYAPLIALYRDDGRLEQSIELIDDAVDRGANSPELLMSKAAILRLTGDADAALRVIERATTDDGLDTARARWLEGMALLDKWFFETATLEEAAEAFDAAVQKNDAFAPARAYSLLVDELGSAEERRSYADELGRLIDKFPDDAHVLRAGALAAMHVASITGSRTGRQELLDEAERFLEHAAERGGNQAILLFDLCRQQMLAADGQRASISCRKARRVGASYLPGLLTMAELERRRGNPADAVALLDELSERFTDEPRISQLKADALIDRFEIDRAEDEINRWAGLSGAKSSLHLLVEGRLSFAKGRYTSALGYFQRAHKHKPHDARAGLYYAQTLTRLGEHDRAEELVKQYLTDLEFEPVAWLVFGEIRRRQGRFSDARENLDLALRKLGDALAPPRHISEAYTQLALAWADRYGFDHRYVGRYLYRGANRGDDDDPALNAARGTYHLSKRRPDRQKAAEAFEKVIAVKPFDCSALDSLRSLYDDEVERVESLHAEHCKD